MLPAQSESNNQGRYNSGQLVYNHIGPRCNSEVLVHNFNPSGAEVTFVQSAKMLRYLKTIYTGGSTQVIPVTSHRSIQKVDVWHRSNPLADTCLFTPPLFKQAVRGHHAPDRFP